MGTGAEVLVAEGMAPLLGQRVGLIANRASLVGDDRLIDVLHRHPEVDVAALFAPEHGVEAEEVGGTTVPDGVDLATGIAIQSLYDDDRAPDGLKQRVMGALEQADPEPQQTGSWWRRIATPRWAAPALAVAG